MDDDIRQCPHCAEDIKRAARVCKHCGRDVEPQEPMPVAAPLPVEPELAQDESARSGRVGRVVAWSAAVALIVILVVINRNDNASPSLGDVDVAELDPPAPALELDPTVIYQVNGQGAANLTLQNASGGTEQLRVQLPWERHFRAGFGEFLYVSAQKNGGGTNQITCRILHDGAVVASASSDAPYGIAQCSS